ncbi:MAG: patatin family protein [Bacteroides sp.]|nr:patatin family protein [Prevotella sp.]MCM1407658.1 patatin family protein [Treponema brennaborense]MCM1469192.1 patatin family protein [Bacteroides sp.]
MEKTSLIIEGGGMRGLYAAGVLDFFIQHNMYWNNVYSVSAGACHGISYISKQFDRARRVNVNYVGSPKYSGLYCMLRHGTFFGFDYIFHDIPAREPIDWYTFFENQNENRRFNIAVTNARTGSAVYLIPETAEQTILYARASSSLPVIGKPAEIGGEIYFDGGIADSIPLQKAQNDGHTKHIIILTRPAGYRKSPLSRTAEKVLRRMYAQYPALIEANLRRAETYNKTLEAVEKLEKQGCAFVFRPNPQAVTSRLCRNRRKLQQLYEAGYADCAAREQELRDKFL